MRLKSLVLGTRETIAGTVYGTIVVLAALTAGGEAYKRDPWRLDVIVGVTMVVLWLAHLYSHALGESLTAGRRLTASELARVARHEFSIPLAALLPIVLITLAALGLLAERTALWLALGIGVITLTAQGVRYARLEQLTPIATSLTIALNLSLGLAIVALEVFVSH